MNIRKRLKKLFTPKKVANQKLFWACGEGSWRGVRRAMELGADINAPTPEGVTPLMRVVTRGDLQMFQQMIIALGADVNQVTRVSQKARGEAFRYPAQLRTALGYAIVYGHTDIVEAAFQLGAQKDAQTDAAMRILTAGPHEADVVEEISVLVASEGQEKLPRKTLRHLLKQAESKVEQRKYARRLSCDTFARKQKADALHEIRRKRDAAVDTLVSYRRILADRQR